MTVTPRMIVGMTTTFDLHPLPKLDKKAIGEEEQAKVDAAVGRLRSPEKRVAVFAQLAAEAEGEAEAKRPRRNELLLWLRTRADEAGIRNLGLPDAMGMWYTRAWTIADKLAEKVDPDDIDPGTAPVGEFRDTAETVFRAEQRKAAAVKARNVEIVRLDDKGVPRVEIHRLAGGQFDPSLISQVVKRAKAST